jgi:predicted CoA-substrate-specific enzyme activase
MYMGIDVGSISAKAVVIRDNGEIGHNDYVCHNGNPLSGVNSILKNLHAHGFNRYRTVCVTGSGRYHIGNSLNTGLIKNEITTLWRAACAINPGAKTILEIGGQDSKLIILHNGEIEDFKLNSVCAAGTGSFIQQQANRLGISLAELSSLALAAGQPAHFTGRCTVFVETEMINLQQRGFPVESIAAGLFEAICENFINDLSPGLTIEPPVLFCGGVSELESARIAFKRKTGMDIIVPRENRVAAAYGAALLARESAEASPTAGYLMLPELIAPPEPRTDACNRTDCLSCGLCASGKNT